MIRTIIYDKVTGLTSAQAISAALYQKANGEGGQYLPVSMMESALYYNWPDLMMNHTFEEGGINLGELADLFEVYETKDGGVVLIIIANDEVFTKFCEVFSLSLHQDEKYNNLVSRIVNKEELTKEINKITRNLSSKELEDKMDNEGISASICNNLNEVHLDPQVIEQGSIVEIDHPELGKMRMPKPPANLKGQKEFPRTLAPILGFDNRQILEELKIENDIIDRMEERENQNRMLIKAMNSMNMPIDFSLVTSTFLKDVVGMNFNSQIPLYLLISIPLILFLFSTKLISKRFLLNRVFPYVLAGGLSMLFLMILLPFALDNLEPISGSRTNIGKLCMTICGCLGGYLYGFRQIRKDDNEI